MATERQKQEAISRMKILTKIHNLNPNLVKYLEEGRVYYSYMVSGLVGCIDTINYDPSYAEIVRKFEKENSAYVYHVIESNWEKPIGKNLTLLYVSRDDGTVEEEWETQRPEGKYIFAYVYVIDDNFGELGDVVLTSDNGALVRMG